MSLAGSSYSGEGGGQKPSVSKLVSGEPFPEAPQWSEKWTLQEYHQELDVWIRKIMDYLRRLANSLIAEVHFDPQGNGSGGGGTVVDVRIDSTTHKLQVKQFGADWTDASGMQFTPLAQIQTDSNYSTSTHILDKTILTDVYILVSGDSSISNIDGAVKCNGGA